MTRPDSPAGGEPPLSPAPRQRIAKLMARVGLCSRRDAEAWIVDGRVSVNGTVLTSPALDVGPEDAIVVDGVPLPGIEKTRLFLFHKPRGLVTSDHDPEGRETVADYLREHWPEGPRVVTIGRLDINTEGLLLLTNDGGLARVLELPKTGWLRRYRVRAKGTADVAALDTLADGITIDGVEYAGIEAKLDRVQGANSWLTMGLREGKNREIKRVLEHLGLEVNRLIRLSFGPFQLQDLPEGAVEEVRPRVLRDQLGESLAAEAGIDLDTILPDPLPRARTEPRGSEPRPGRTDDRAKTARRPPDRLRKPPDGRTARPRRDDRDEAPQPLRERPQGGPRKHVSTLRRVESDAARNGPRKRIERTDTQDRRDRTIKVERLVSTRPAPDRPHRRTHHDDKPAARSTSRDEAPRGGRPARDDRPARGPVRWGAPRPGIGDRRRDETRPPRRDDRPEGRGPETRRGDGASAPRRHASPSALGKRERMARSGAPDRRRDDDGGARREHDDRKGRTPRAAEGARPRHDDRRGPRTPRAQDNADAGAREARRPRDGADRGDSTGRVSRGAKPGRRDAPAGAARDGRPREEKPRTGRPMGAASRKPGGKPSAGAPHRGKPRGPARPPKR